MKKVMIVDDEFLVRLGIKSLLRWEEYGYEIAAEAENGEEAMPTRFRPCSAPAKAPNTSTYRSSSSRNLTKTSHHV